MAARRAEHGKLPVGDEEAGLRLRVEARSVGKTREKNRLTEKEGCKAGYDAAFREKKKKLAQVGPRIPKGAERRSGRGGKRSRNADRLGGRDRGGGGFDVKK